MPKVNQRDVVKERHWRQAIAGWRSSGLSVAEYCRQKGLECTHFYEWNRRLRVRDARSGMTQASRKGSVERRIHRDAEQVKTSVPEKQSATRSVEFAEVRVVDRASQTYQPSNEHTVALEIVFTSGTKLRLGSGCPVQLLSSVISVLENR